MNKEKNDYQNEGVKNWRRSALMDKWKAQPDWMKEPRKTQQVTKKQSIKGRERIYKWKKEEKTEQMNKLLAKKLIKQSVLLHMYDY